jgi:Kef-type K+ transport system membrane component KefB
MEKILGFLAPTIIAFIIFILNAILPGRWVAGYITRPDSNEKMRYHLNGIFVFIVPLFAWFDNAVRLALYLPLVWTGRRMPSRYHF